MDDFGFEEDGDQYDDDLVKAIQNSLEENLTLAANLFDDGKNNFDFGDWPIFGDESKFWKILESVFSQETID